MEPWFVLLLVAVLAALAVGLFFLGRAQGRPDPREAADAVARSEELIRARAQLEDRSRRVSELEATAESDRRTIVGLSERLSARESDLASQKRRLEEVAAQREEEARRLTREFENLATRVLDANSKKITNLQEEKIGQILRPVSERLVEFQKSVQELRSQGISHHAEFKNQLETLRQTGNALGEEAKNLTQALRGQKTQGMWGEFILEKVLETSGLRKDIEYRTQESHTAADGSRLQPDVVVHLPENKHLIIDAKVSLTAYLRLTECTDEADRKAALKDHLASLRSHVDNLASKGYEAIGDLRSPEIVLLFVPVEPAFIEALRADPSLFDYAFSRKIVLVTPSTLLATLKTVASLWRQEKQNRNALEIARLGGELYDKFAGFAGDLDEVGKRLEQARTAHDNARSKLTEGRGNAVRTIERMKELGLKTRKELDPDRVERALEEDDAD